MNEQIEKTLTTLAEKFGTSVEHLFTVMVRQANIHIWILLFQFLFVGAFCFGIWKLYRWKSKNDIEYSLEGPFQLLIIVGAAISGIMILMCVFEGVPELITCISNPEYWALRQIIK